MTDQITFGIMTVGVVEDIPNSAFLPAIEDVSGDYKHGYEAGLRAQFQIDCEAECSACGKPDKYHPALWVERDNTYQHETIKGGKMEYCDATILKMNWYDLHGEASGKPVS